MPKYVEIPGGSTFGDWTIVERATNNKYGNACFLARCICGNETTLNGCALRHGKTTRCRTCAHFKHGKTVGKKLTPEYIAWGAIIQRCCNPNCAAYHNYGGRGIKVCDVWKSSFKAFFDFVGERPTSKHSIDRFPDNDGNYEPGNVRWATAKEQRFNQRQRLCA